MPGLWVHKVGRIAALQNIESPAGYNGKKLPSNILSPLLVTMARIAAL